MAAEDSADGCDVEETGEGGGLGGVPAGVWEESEGEIHHRYDGHQVGGLGVFHQLSGVGEIRTLVYAGGEVGGMCGKAFSSNFNM